MHIFRNAEHGEIISLENVQFFNAQGNRRTVRRHEYQRGRVCGSAARKIGDAACQLGEHEIAAVIRFQLDRTIQTKNRRV